MHIRLLLGILFLSLGSSTRCVAQGISAAQPSTPDTTMGRDATATAQVQETLTREEAEQIALRNNPRVSISHLLAMAQHQVVRESRSGELPLIEGSLTAEAANNGSRVASGSLSDSRLFQHAGGGIALSQLITDFGHTGNLVASSRLQERAQNASELATREDIVLATDEAFYDALQAQSLLQVAKQTVAARQSTQGQVNQLTQNKLRSTLDLTFADVNVSQAQLLQLDATSHASAAMAALDEVLGLDHEVDYILVDSQGAAPPPPPEVEVLTQLALKQRPDLQSLDFDRQAQQKLSRAQADQRLPTVSALGTVGVAPVRPGQYFIASWDGGVAANVNIPIFNGFLFSSQAKESSLRANAAGEQTRRLRNQIVRDVHTAWLEANNAFLRIGVTDQLLNQSNQSLKLAQTRYQLGLSSIVELSQAQLQQTEADIGHTNAEYQYRLALAALNYQTGTQP
jgi:outer membrane protein